MKIKLFITNRQTETPSPQTNSFQQLDLFEDENIFYENKLRELDEVGAVFNDSTNTFSVPATKRNNKILKYWFEINYIKTDSITFNQTQKTFNPQKRVEAYIEIGTIPYRFGRLQLENIETERGLPTSYSLTFYSEVLSLEEVFGEDTLRDLISSNDESDYEFEWTLDNVRDLMTRFSSAVRNINNEAFERDLMIPLIFSHEGDISYKTGEDSDISLNPLSTSKFRPSYKLLRLINLIEQKYNLKFDSKFFETPAFQNLYVWLNRNEDIFVQPFNLGEVVLTGDNIDLTYYSFSGSGSATQEFLPNISLTLANDLSKVHKFDNNTGIMTSTYDYKQPWFQIPLTSSYRIKTFVTIQLERVNNAILPRGEVEVFDVETGNTFEVLSEPGGTVSQYFSTVLDVNYNADNLQDNTFPPETVQNIGFRYVVDGVDSNVVGINIDFATRVYSVGDGYQTIVEKFNIGSLVNFVSFPTNGVKTNFNIKNNLPDITVLDFLKGLIKQFNLIIRPKKFELIGSGDTLDKRVTYVVDTFESYINSGNVLDLTPNLDLEKAVSERKEVDKSISFLYEENDSIFAEIQGYGNGRQVFDVDSKENREIEFGLEISLPTRLKSNLEGTDTNLNMYVLQDEEGEPTWTENLLIHYNNGVVRVDDNTAEIGTIKMDYSGTEFELSEVPLIDSSNSESFNQVTNDMNFSSVGSNWHKVNLTDKNQYANYFKPYLDNIYDKQNRVTNFNLNLPYNLISKLDLDSTVLIQNNQYLVEDVKINLLNGETSLKVYPSITNRFLSRREGFIEADRGSNSLFYGYNQGYHNSSVEFFTKSNCTIEKIDNGSGTGWIDLKTTEFNINQQNPLANQFSIIFDIEFNASFTTNRSMQLKVTTDSNEYFLNIFQASGFTQLNVLQKCSDSSVDYYLSPNSTFVIGGDFVGNTILPNDTRVIDVNTGDTYITIGQTVDVEGLTEIEADITDQTGC